MSAVGIVLLAAGGSSRMGSPKQLVDFQGKKLIQIVAERLLACRCFPTVVVLGANAAEILPYLAGYELNVLQNLNWQEGMASSIHCGVEFLEAAFPEVRQLLVAVVDQPFVEAEHYYALVEEAEAAPDKVVAAYYGGQAGVPVVFPRRYWPMLRRMRGDQGARGWLRELDDSELVRVAMPSALRDWDQQTDI